MKKIYFLFTFLATTFVHAQTNLITNGTFDNNGSSWTAFTIKSDSEGSATITGGNATFTSIRPTGNNWDHFGIYQAVTLAPGTYVIDFDISFSGIDDTWSELLIGNLQPENNKDYKVGASGSDQVAALGFIEEVYNTWDCSNGINNNPLISSTGASNNGSVEKASIYVEKAAHVGNNCDTSSTPGSLNFEITTAGTYYIVFKTGNWDGTFGSNGVTIDNVTLFDANALSTDNFDDETFTAYPNPANDFVKFSLKETVENISLFNLLGQKVLSKDINSREFSVDIKNLQAGTYVAKLNNKGKSKLVKLIKI